LYDQRGKATADLIGLQEENPEEMDHVLLRHPTDHTKLRSLRKDQVSEIEPLLVEILRQGKLVYELPTIEQIRQQRRSDVERLDPGVRRIMYPHIYHVSLTERMWSLKQELIEASRVT
jgi:nicotinate phosphoribosyltransferase